MLPLEYLCPRYGDRWVCREDEDDETCVMLEKHLCIVPDPLGELINKMIGEPGADDENDREPQWVIVPRAFMDELCDWWMNQKASHR